ncbi:hypothetical protein [Aquimarina aquimarini]|uniref:hypothetical protein n=1 Tax=Aquimarina aquimarini TaxID=1191734 RepID=UPI00131F0F64|nr:hypothetical protein [Aquimarina aquimarini]
MMKLITYFFSLFLFVNSYANNVDQILQVEKEGLVVVVVDFKEGDKIKLFEVESGDHVLSKTHGEIDLSQLPLGAYLLENNQGESVVIVRTEEEIDVVGALENIKNNFIVENDAENGTQEFQVEDVEEEFMRYYKSSEMNILEIEREGDFVTVINFEEGDKIKLFEVKDTVHILSKTTNFIDLSQLPAGVYVLENNRGDAVVIEKFDNSDDLIVDM